MRPPNHMPCPADEATVAVLGEATFEKHEDRWRDSGLKYVTGSTKDLIRYGATFYKPVPNPPENTRELTEEEMGNTTYNGFLLNDRGKWMEHIQWDTRVASNDGTEPWRCRVPIEKKVVAWVAFDGNEPDRTCYVACFDTKELRDRAVAEANARANRRES